MKEDGLELPSRIYLFQALPKGDKMELVIQKAVELGAFAVIPVAAKRCVVKLDAKKEAVNAGKKLYEAGKRTLDIPIQFSELMRMVTKGRIKLNLEIMDSSVPLKTINHMVNKLVVGIVSCGLLMASSLICTTDMTPKVLGIPAIGFIGYMTAVFLGMWLLYTVLKDKRR